VAHGAFCPPREPSEIVKFYKKSRIEWDDGPVQVEENSDLPTIRTLASSFKLLAQKLGNTRKITL